MKLFIYTPILCLTLGCAPTAKHYVFEPLPGELSPANPAPVTPPVVAPPKPVKPAPVVAAPAPVLDPAPAPAESASSPAGDYQVSVKPVRLLNGRIVNVQDAAGVVVVNFPIGQLPELNRNLAVYRNGVRVGEILITGPQRDDNIAADIVSGELKVGDEARDR